MVNPTDFEKLSIEPRLPQWQQTLSKIESEPLGMCSDFPRIAQAWKRWWRYALDRPNILAAHLTHQDIRKDKAFDLLDEPEQWLDVHLKQLEAVRRFGESMPAIRVDIGPVSTAAYVGAPLHFAMNENTSWQDTIIHSWEDPPKLEFDPDNEWFTKVMRVMDLLAQHAAGKFLVCLPDLTGPMDVLANLRGSELLCFDLVENRQKVIDTAMHLVDAWEQAFVRMYDLVLGHGAGVTQFITCWADQPFTVPTCDFNALIGPADFREVCLPSYKQQARRAGLCVIHLDGPDASRHAETLAEDPDITAVQYTPGAGTPSALAKLPMFKMFQKHHKPLFIECPADEVKELCQALEPNGLAVRIGDPQSQQQLEDLMQWREQYYG